jgi:hypothetical protein
MGEFRFAAGAGRLAEVLSRGGSRGPRHGQECCEPVQDAGQHPEIVGWDRSNAGVGSHTQISPPSPREAIIDIRRSRTGSPSALNTFANSAAWSSFSGAADIAVQQAVSWPITSSSCFDMPYIDVLRFKAQGCIEEHQYRQG